MVSSSSIVLLALVVGVAAVTGPAAAQTDSVCNDKQYCCPDAGACLTPTNTSCLHDAKACAAGQACCPITKLCVVPGPACTSPCGANEYCCPDAKHCLTPDPAGVLCKTNADCDSGVCCPVTKICVKVGNACVPPLETWA